MSITLHWVTPHRNSLHHITKQLSPAVHTVSVKCALHLIHVNKPHCNQLCIGDTEDGNGSVCSACHVCPFRNRNRKASIKTLELQVLFEPCCLYFLWQALELIFSYLTPSCSVNSFKPIAMFTAAFLSKLSELSVFCTCKSHLQQQGIKMETINLMLISQSCVA